MNSKTASHMNKLLELATPSTWTMDQDTRYYRLTSPTINSDLRLVNAILVKHAPAAQEAEIRRAAAARRAAGTDFNVLFSSNGVGLLYHGDGYSRLVAELAEQEILAALAASSAERLARYEAYRMACEQGVAVPPEA